MELNSVSVDTLKSRVLPELDEIVLCPMGDIQLDPKLRGRERSCDIDRLKRHVDWAVENNAYYIGMGDYVDVASPSNRDAIKRANFYDNVQDAMEEMAEQTDEELREILKPTVGRWLGLLEGHHYFQYEDGTTTDTRLAQFLKCPHLGTTSMVEVKFPVKGHKAQPSFVVWAHHGLGGGSTLGRPLNQLENVLKTFDADVYLVGHHHKKVIGKYARLHAEFGRNGEHRLVHKNVVLAGTGSYLKGYMQGSRRGNVPRGSYVEQGMMNPVALGGIVVRARPRYEGGYSSVDLEVSA